MIAAAEFQNLNRAPARLVFQRIAQDHDVVGDELLDAKSRHRPVIVGSFRRQHRGHSHRLQRRGNSEKLAPHHRLIRELREHSAERIDGDSLRLDFFHGVVHARDQRPEVEAARFYRVDVRVRRSINECELAFRLPRRQIPAEAAHVPADVRRRFLERHEHARFALLDSRGEKLDGEDGLAAARRSGDERRPIFGESAFGDDVPGDGIDFMSRLRSFSTAG